MNPVLTCIEFLKFDWLHFGLVPYRYCINFLSRFWRGMKEYYFTFPLSLHYDCLILHRATTTQWLAGHRQGKGKKSDHVHSRSVANLHNGQEFANNTRTISFEMGSGQNGTFYGSVVDVLATTIATLPEEVLVTNSNNWKRKIFSTWDLNIHGFRVLHNQ